jgi:diguanylate cyclase (GGDEF)-like protein
MDQPPNSSFNQRQRVSEAERLGILNELGLLDTPPEAEFDTLVRIAQQVSCCKIALISLVDRDRQWFKAKRGLEQAETPREYAFCANAIGGEGMMVVPDARTDDRFRLNPLVTGSPDIVFYAGVPLLVRADVSETPRVAAIGTLCVIHDKPHDLTEDQQTTLRELARLAEVLVERRLLTKEAQTLADQRKADLRTTDLLNRQFRQAERLANIGSWRLTLCDNRTQWSDQVYAIHGLPIGEKPSLQNALDFYPGEARSIISNAVSQAAETGRSFDVETDFLTAQGELRRVRSVGEVEIRGGQPIAVIGVFQDVTQQYGLEERLRRTAHRDDLTGLPNRAHFNEFLDCKLDNAERNGSPLAVLAMDLDGFKDVNDTCGHLAGDAILKEIGRRLLASASDEIFFARLGGDEFGAVMTGAVASSDLEARISRLLRETRIETNQPDGGPIVTTTIGACSWTYDIQNASDMLHRADQALYEAKRAGKAFGKIAGKTGFIFPA